MFKWITGAFAKAKTEKDFEYGLRVVQERWLAYRSLSQKRPEHEIIEFAGPFIVPTMAVLASDSRWAGKSQSAKLDLIFVVLLADADTEVDQNKLRAMRDLLEEGA